MRGVFCSLLLASICVACSDLGGLTGGDENAPGGGGGQAGGKGGGDGAECAGDQCLPAPADVIYVAEGGNDTNDGKSSDKPKKTIGGAIALLETTAAPNFEIHVCRGTYRESVVLDFSTSIRGGYECSTWKRADGNETIIAAPDGAPALTVRGVTGVTVDGLSLRASDANATTRSIAVLVGAGSSVKLSGDRISGAGGTTKLSPASAGVYLENGGAAQIEKSFVEGGSAANEGGGYGSAGVAIGVGKEHEGCSLTIVESEIRGGSGSVSSGTGSVGILGLYGTVSSIEKNVINGGTGKTGYGSASVGALISSTVGDVAFIGNKVDGGFGTCTADCSVIGASLSPKGAVKISGNRITAGDASAVGHDVRFLGLGVNDSPNADIQNNQIFTGNTKHSMTSSAGAIETRGLGTAIVAQNTLVLGSTFISDGTVLVLDAKQGTVANNLFLNAAGTSAYAVRVNACKDAKVVSFRNNAWAGFSDTKPILAIDKTNPQNTIVCTTAATTATTSATAESSLSSTYAGIAVAGNQRLTSSFTSLLGTWNETTANDLLATGWKLAATAACTVVKGSGDVGGLSPTDAFGTARTNPRSIGASESDGACQ